MTEQVGPEAARSSMRENSATASPLNTSSEVPPGLKFAERITTRLGQGRLHDGEICTHPMGEYDGPSLLGRKGRKELLPARAPEDVVAYRICGFGHSAMPRMAAVERGDLVVRPVEDQLPLLAELHETVVAAYYEHAGKPHSFDPRAMREAMQVGAEFCNVRGLSFELH